MVDMAPSPCLINRLAIAESAQSRLVGPGAALAMIEPFAGVASLAAISLLVLAAEAFGGVAITDGPKTIKWAAVRSLSVNSARSARRI